MSQKTTVNNSFETQRLYFKGWACHSLDVCYHITHLTSLNFFFLLGKMKTVSVCNGYLLILLPCIHFLSLFHCYSNNFTFFFLIVPSYPTLCSSPLNEFVSFISLQSTNRWHRFRLSQSMQSRAFIPQALMIGLGWVTWSKPDQSIRIKKILFWFFFSKLIEEIDSLSLLDWVLCLWVWAES